MRLFDTEFPDVFLWLLDVMGEVPLPRKEQNRVVSNSLKLDHLIIVGLHDLRNSIMTHKKKS
ncbi:MAG: hypothetical protein GQ581_01830 [Methyloprofundus sp.]|nr:hypothetical protein [Methyloprofundus sp.]